MKARVCPLVTGLDTYISNRIAKITGKRIPPGRVAALRGIYDTEAMRKNQPPLVPTVKLSELDIEKTINNKIKKVVL